MPGAQCLVLVREGPRILREWMVDEDLVPEILDRIDNDPTIPDDGSVIVSVTGWWDA